MTRGTGEGRHPAGPSSLDADTLEAATDAENYMRTNAATTPLADLDPFVDLSQSELLAVQRPMTPVRVRAVRNLTNECGTGREFMISAIRRLHSVDHGPAD